MVAAVVSDTKLPCVSAYRNCNGVECENSVQQEVSSDEDSVESDEEDRNI